jgi:hypothetical protein
MERERRSVLKTTLTRLPRINNRHRVVAAVLVLGSVCLVLASTLLLIGNLLSGIRPGAFSGKRTVTLYQPVAPLAEEEESAVIWRSQPPEVAHVDIEINRQLVSEQRLETAISLVVPKAWLGQFYYPLPDGELRPISKDDKLVDEYRELALTLHVDDSYSDVRLSVPLPLRPLFAGSETRGNSVAVSAVELSLWGPPELFPSDWYVFDGRVSVELPPHLILIQGPHWDWYLPLTLTVKNGVGMAGRRVALAREERADEPFAREFRVMITRDLSLVVYSYLMALVPVAFAFMLLHLLFWYPGLHEEKASALVVEPLVATLAILPLRAVLVPGDVSGITRVDLLLGTGLALIVGLALCRYAQRAWHLSG